MMRLSETEKFGKAYESGHIIQVGIFSTNVIKWPGKPELHSQYCNVRRNTRKRTNVV